MGRAPCCDKANVKKGPWSPEEDAKLKAYIEQHGTGGNWIALPQKIGLKRCGKSCRLRWLNYLRPNIKHGGFSEEEDNLICSLYITIGSRWSIIAAQLPGRTDNDIKNYWNTRLKKKLQGKQRKEQLSKRGCGVKQEMMNGDSDHFMAAAADTASHTPCWADPIPPSSSPYPNIHDHSAIKRLLIKLGGRFSDNPQQTNGDEARLPPHFYDNSINSSVSTPSCTDVSSSMFSAQYSINYANMQFLSHAPSSASPELNDLINISGPQKLEAFDCLYGSSSSVEIPTGIWGDSSSTVVCPPAYEGYQQSLLHDCVLNDQRYFAAS